MKLEFVEARDLPDAWFQSVYRLLEAGREYTIDRGSYAGQKRLEFDYVTVQIKHPGVRPLLPDIPPLPDLESPAIKLFVRPPVPEIVAAAVVVIGIPDFQAFDATARSVGIVKQLVIEDFINS